MIISPYSMVLALVTLVVASATLFGTYGESRKGSPGMLEIREGTYTALYREPGEAAGERVEAFYLSRFPVTNGDYLEFVEANPSWRRSRIPALFADDGYLSHWSSDLSYGADSLADRPVVNVSWFAARAYAEWKGVRLPTTAEWEHAAASRGTPDGAERARLLAWYSRPAHAALPPVGSTDCNDAGVCGLHGLVWEWVEDFNSALVTGESRNDGDLDLRQFCGSAAINAKSFDDYAAFLRFGFRSGLEANYTVRSLGFRLASNLP